jgi:hypothetical protein
MFGRQQDDPPDDRKHRQRPRVRMGSDNWGEAADTVPVRQLSELALGLGAAPGGDRYDSEAASQHPARELPPAPDVRSGDKPEPRDATRKHTARKLFPW